MTPTSPSTPKVFISYRRADTAGHAGRLYDAMVARFGEPNVFMDVDMKPGVDFVERITSVVAACHVLLVVMGPDWARPPDGETQPRIADPEDFVRLEVATALRRDDVTVIPLLVERASMPQAEDLPEGLRALTRRNALELDDLRWHEDVKRLMVAIEEVLGQHAEPEAASAPAVAPGLPAGPQGPAAPAAAAGAGSWLRSHRRLAVAVAAGVVVLIAVVVAALPGNESDPAVATAPATNSGAATGGGGRPAGVPASCQDKGLTPFAKNSSAVKEWSDCDPGPVEDVKDPALTYLEFADAASAHESFVGGRQFELDNGWTLCDEPRLERFFSDEAFCAQSDADKTVEIYWHGQDARVMGLETFDPPTTVPNAVKAWSTVV
jgi:hypothetical protein